MLCLTNCVPDYGGLWKYVSWAEKTNKDKKPGFEDKERYKFFATTSKDKNEKVAMAAQKRYEDYIDAVVKHCNDKNYTDLIHSWDICNEPRNLKLGRTQGDTEAIYRWVNASALQIKGLDSTHPVTVGTEGFFGPPGPGKKDFGNYNPSGNSSWSEGANWLKEAEAAIDFCCIHPYWDQWKKFEQEPKDWLTGNIAWIDGHIKASNGKPLVLQEFNMPASKKVGDVEIPLDPMVVKEMRLEYYKKVTERLKPRGGLTGAMLWQVCYEGYPGDRYQIDPSNYEDYEDALRSMCEAVKRQPATT